MKIEISPENEEMIRTTAKVFRLTEDEIVNRIIMFFRAYKVARVEESKVNRFMSTLEFTQEEENVFDVLYQLLRTQYQDQLTLLNIPFEDRRLEVVFEFDRPIQKGLIGLKEFLDTSAFLNRETPSNETKEEDKVDDKQ